MISISARDSLPGRCLICSDGSNRCASQSANSLQKSSRQQYSAVISIAIEGLPDPGLTLSVDKPMLSKPWVFGNPLNPYPEFGLLIVAGEGLTSTAFRRAF